MSRPEPHEATTHAAGTGPAASTAVPLAAALLGAAIVAFLGLRDFSFTDYEVEAKPAIDLLVDGRVGAFFSALPGYGGALLLQGPFAVVGDLIGPDHDLWAWRGQGLPGLLLLVVLGTALGRHVARSVPGRPGLAWGALTALLIGGAPFGLLALQTGHTEELLVTGLAVAAVLLAARGNVVTAAAVVGVAAAAKPWAVIAVPVVLLAAADRRTLLRAGGACVVAVALTMTPAFVAGGAAKVQASAHSSTTGIFKPDNVFWFAGRPNPAWSTVQSATTDQLFQTDAAKAAWAQRLEPAWAGRVSHPLIVAVAVLIAAAFWRLRPRLAGREDLLLLLAAVCWWRCVLDTWNVHYYALAALVALAAWEARRGRPPVVAAVVTTLAWTTFQLVPASSLTPDVHTALYLAWALPLGAGMLARALAPAWAAGAAARLTAPVAAQLPSLARLVSARPAA